MKSSFAGPLGRSLSNPQVVGGGEEGPFGSLGSSDIDYLANFILLLAFY